MMNGLADLHTHTVFSDGANTPCDLVRLAAQKGISAIAITDHDSVNGVPEAFECGRQAGIEVIPGLEISTDVNDVEVHLIGLFVDFENAELQKYLEFFRTERLHRAERIIKKLEALNVEIFIEEVLEEAKNSAIGRPHIANILYRKGYVENYLDAFHKYLGDYAPAFERKIHVSLQSAIKLINDAGGLAILAHPGRMSEELLTQIIHAGIDGIEVVHPSHNLSLQKFYTGLVEQYCLLASGGSDYHGGIKDDDENFAKFTVRYDFVEEMKKMLPQKVL
jgi:predicted metal-dependent phosphoesterase TrpH